MDLNFFALFLVSYVGFLLGAIFAAAGGKNVPHDADELIRKLRAMNRDASIARTVRAAAEDCEASGLDAAAAALRQLSAAIREAAPVDGEPAAPEPVRLPGGYMIETPRRKEAARG